MSGSRQYDVVVFGSTGYTGQFVNEELYRIQGEGKRQLKWAAAARSQSKLEAYLKESGIEGIDMLIADTNDQASLEEMCAKASVIINCVGPYQVYGEQVVKACIAQKTNYVDITGETYFMEVVAARYDEQARDAGVYIVSSCGYDCVPNDLGALLLQRSFNGELAHVESFMSISSEKPTRFNTGTWESFLLSISNHSKLTAHRKQQGLPPIPFPTAKAPKHGSLFYSDLVNRWCLPFPGPDKAVVCRSMRYRKDHEGVEPFNFSTYSGLGSLGQAVGMFFFFLMLLPMVVTNCGRNLLSKYPNLFTFGKFVSTGPSRKELENVTFTVSLHGTGYAEDADRSKPPQSKLNVKVWGIDPGYGATSALLVQSALCFVYEKDALPPTGGVYTPAVAFGNTKIIQNLESTGKIKFEILPGQDQA